MTIKKYCTKIERLRLSQRDGTRKYFSRASHQQLRGNYKSPVHELLLSDGVTQAAARGN